MARHVVLVGLMAAGKTTVGRALAEELGRPLLDNDVLLGESAAGLGRSRGVDALHAREADVLLEALRHPDPAVVAAAASVIENPVVRAALADHVVVWLTADPGARAARLPGEAHRPALPDDPARRRADVDAAAADLVIDTGTTAVAEAVRQVVDLLASATGEGRR